MHYLNLQEGKKKARKLARIYDAYHQDSDFSYVGSAYEQTLRRTRVPCSCVMCGNPRHYAKGKDKLTLADKRRNDCASAQMNEVG